MILVSVNALMGLITFEWAYQTTRRFRLPMSDLHSKFPNFCRLDSHLWSRWKMWPGAMTMLWPRFIICCILGVILWGVAAILLIGQKPEQPVVGCRRGCMRFWYVFLCTLQGVLGWFTHYTYVYEQNVDYSYWLGGEPNPKTAHSGERASMIVSNHHGIHDIMGIIISPLMPAFTPQEQQRNAPLLGPITRMLGSVYCDRGGTEEQRNKFLDIITAR